MFVNLHTHTQYSILDGMADIKDLVSRAKALGQESLAITDHGSMFGVIKFYKECKTQGIKPIIGCEVYTAERTMRDKDAKFDSKIGHLVLLCKNISGYKNLIEIVSDAYTEGFYYKPRTDKGELKKHSEGLIALSGCLAGKIQRLILENKYEEAKAEALEMNEIFGDENFYLELQDHGQEEDKKVIDTLIKISNETGIPLVATNDSHYVRKDDWMAHEVLICLQTNGRLADPDHFKFPSHEFYLKSEEEMRSSFPAEACDNTEKIANMCNLELEFGNYHIPAFCVPEGFNSEEEYFEHLCYKGFEERYGENDELKEKLKYEIDTIKNMGYVGYFLIVQDYINYAKNNGIAVGPARGSAAGSIAAYCLHITELEPTQYNLIFERFLNPERISMPDIDVDFEPKRRSEVVSYVAEKYGHDSVCQISTFGTMKSKMAIRDVARVLDMPYQEANNLSKMIPEGFSLKEALDNDIDMKSKYDHDLLTQKVIDMAIKLENTPRSVGTHAAGVVISSDQVKRFVPLVSSSKGVATQFDMNEVEEQGLLKMDFLGLRNLSVIQDTVKMVKENHNVDIDINNIPLDDDSVYEMLSKGKTVGVFQLESKGITDCMKKLKPSCFEDIIAGVSLYRPGPMDSIPDYIKNKKHPEKIKYATEKLKPILDVTYGVIVYQEQVMRIVRDLAGYSYGRSDLVRRYMSKKKMDKMLEEKEYFINGKLDEEGNIEIPGCVRNGISKEVAEALYDEMTSFAAYAFNKSHAAAYSLITYQTAWLRYYYPVEFMAALMTSVQGDAEHLELFIKDAKKIMIPGMNKKIKIVPPSINISKGEFTATKDGEIVFGLNSIKNVGASVSRDIELSRERGITFSDLYTFFEALSKDSLNVKNIEGLIRAGAIKFHNVNTLLNNYNKILDYVKSGKKNVDQITLFELIGSDVGIRPEIEECKELDTAQLLAMEKDSLGVYVSGHPLRKYKALISEFTTLSSEDLSNGANKRNAIMAGLVVDVKTIFTKRNNEKMAFVTIEDENGTFEATVFPKIYRVFESKLFEGSLIAIKGKIDDNGSLLIDDVSDIEDIEKFSSAKNKDEYNILKVKCSKEEAEKIETLIGTSFRGIIPVLWYDVDTGKQYWLTKKSRYDGLLQIKLKNMIGGQNVKWDNV